MIRQALPRAFKGPYLYPEPIPEPQGGKLSIGFIQASPEAPMQDHRIGDRVLITHRPDLLPGTITKTWIAEVSRIPRALVVFGGGGWIITDMACLKKWEPAW